MKRLWFTMAAGLFVALRALHASAGAAANPGAQAGSIPSRTLPALVFVEAPVVRGGSLTQRFPQGSHLVKLILGHGPTRLVPLAPEFYAVADPQVSFDGSRVLFSAERAKGDSWQVWEIAADGSAPRQITHGAGDRLQPKYLPQNRIVYTAVEGAGAQRMSQVDVSGIDGTDAQPITFGPGNFQVETVLRSGRILVSAETPLIATASKKNPRTLFTLRPDGSGLSLFRDDFLTITNGGGAIELADGTIVFLETNKHSAARELASIRQGALHASTLTKSPADYDSAEPLDGTTLVVARTDAAPEKGRNYDLYAFDLDSMSLGNLLYQNAAASSVEAVPLVPNALPQIYWSILHPKTQTGRILCLNSYLSKDVASGRLPGRIAKVRVLTLQQPGNRERIVGEAPVESDGSFYATVPADAPIRFELFGPKGERLHAQRSWIWVRNGEDRGCQGCHDSPALAPANHFPLTLRRSDTPTVLGRVMPAPREGQR